MKNVGDSFAKSPNHLRRIITRPYLIKSVFRHAIIKCVTLRQFLILPAIDEIVSRV